MNASDGNSVQAEAAHEEYLAEVRQLVDQQVAALFQMVSGAASRAGAGASGGAVPSVGQSDDNRTLTVSNGGRAVTFTVEAVTDLPEGSDRANAFPAGQARCIVSTPNGTIDEWVLHRVGGGETPQYTWMRSGTETPVDEAGVVALLQSA